MSERIHVEKPFLDQLAALDWKVIDLGETLPTDPGTSRRTNFKEVALKQDFIDAVRAVNRLPDGRTWLTDSQLSDIFSDLTSHTGTLVEVNRDLHHFLLNGYPVDENTVTGEKGVKVKLIDFDEPTTNQFLAISQFRVNTPGQVKEHIRPDIVLFVNGLPLVVIECKEASAFTSQPLEEAKTQILRYAERRDESTKGGYKEGEERLFHFNLFSIASTGTAACFGSITTDKDDFQPWKAIVQAKYAQFKGPLGGTPRPQEVLIQGMLARETLIDILQNFTLFGTKAESIVKVVCRYQQYRAILRAMERIRTNPVGERGGVIWHTQGSGKSLTMVFFVKKLRSSKDLFDLKVIMVNDRTDLEEQLGGTAELTGEKVTIIGSTEDLKTKLQGSNSGLYLVMVHKFREPVHAIPQSVQNALGIKYDGLRVKPFDRVNNSDRIVVFIDEAHRTQYTDLGNNLAIAFPNATRIAFTGTPLITKRHKQTTIGRFGPYIDTYKLRDAQDDNAVVPIIYVGRTANAAIGHKSEFDEKFDDLFAERTEEEIAAIKAKYGGKDDILEAEARIRDIAKDLVKHYIENILPDGFKAQVVCNSRVAALRYKAAIDTALAEYAARLEKGKSSDAALIEQVKFLKSAVVVSSEGTNELAGVLAARKEAKELDAVNNFLKRFDPAKPETGIAFLVVCDMLLTGFDAPIEQVMYLDKPVREHTLLQTIARVNRTAPGKKRGFIVDYIGLTKHLREALDIYAGEDVDEFLACFRSMDDEANQLEARFERLISFFRENKLPEASDWIWQKLPVEDEYLVFELMMDLVEDVKNRETFDVLLTLFLQSMNTVLPDPRAAKFDTPAKRLVWFKVQVRDRYKDDTLDLGSAGEKVKRLVNEHLVSLGVDPKIPPVELLSADFVKTIEKRPSSTAKASEMEHALRKHVTVHLDEDPAFFGPLSEKLERVLKEYKDNWDALAQQLSLLVKEAQEGRNKGPTDGVEPKAVPFFELVLHKLYEGQKAPAPERNHVKSFANDILPLLKAELSTPNFWGQPHKIRELEGEIFNRLVDTGIDRAVERAPELATTLLQLAKARHNDLIS